MEMTRARGKRSRKHEYNVDCFSFVYMTRKEEEKKKRRKYENKEASKQTNKERKKKRRRKKERKKERRTEKYVVHRERRIWANENVVASVNRTTRPSPTLERDK